MERQEFIHSSTAIRSMESQLLTKEQLDRMIEAEDIEGAIRVLQETIYSDSFSKIKKPEEYDQAIGNELIKLYDTVKELSPDESIINILELKYDTHNLKVLFKDHIMGTDNSELIYPIGTAELARIVDLAEKGNRKAIDELLDGLATETVYGYQDSLDPQVIDLAVDRKFYEKLFEVGKNADTDLIKSYANDYIDFSNLIALFRMQRQNRDIAFAEQVITTSGNIKKEDLLNSFHEPMAAIVDRFKASNIGNRLLKGLEEFEANSSISSFEKEFDNHLMDLVKNVKFITFGPEVIFAYLISREMEIKNIRNILVSKLNKLSPEFIRERLRETYV